ncbi:cytochrome c-type biogenesis protein CcmH [Myxococcota bacterium]|nr:cytochrome c-type biogenesis protein CcmH [Myxococcota bacterium]
MKTVLALALLAGAALAEDVSSASTGASPAAASAADPAPQPLDEPPLLPPPASDAETDATTAVVSDGLRCPVCQGLSVNDSPADGARAMKARIRELVAMGYSQEQIEDYFVARYGTWVLLAPPAERQHWAVYLAPVVFLGGGLAVIGWSYRNRRTAAPVAGAPAPTPADEGRAAAPADELEDDDLEPYRRRILAELGLSAPGEGR